MTLLTLAETAERLGCSLSTLRTLDVPRHPCPGPRCMTNIPLDRDICHGCRRMLEQPTKACLRCGYGQPLSHFAWGGRGRLCDSCRDAAPMTDEERRRSARLAPSHIPWVRRARYRQRRAA